MISLFRLSAITQPGVLHAIASRACSSHATKTVSAVGVTSSTAKLEPLKISRRALDNDDVGIDIQYCGICHTDLHCMHNEWKDSGVPISYPFVPGHEILGKVSAVGSNVKTVKDKPEPYTYGGFSKYIVTDHRYINTVPKNLDMKRAPPLLCAGVTVFSPLKLWNVGKGTRLGIYGVGGLGHLAVKLGAAMGAEVSVLSRSDKRRSEAKRLGAHDYVVTNSPDDVAKRSGYFDVILDCVSAPHDIDSLINMLRNRVGTLAMVGLPDQPLNFRVHDLAFGSKKIGGTLVGSIAEAQEVLDFCAEHQVYPDVEVIEMKDVNDAMKRLAKSDVKYRFVIDMSTF
ncbi:hypothetical protein ACOME3_008253 [Neoechinorhynchus agilis]